MHACAHLQLSGPHCSSAPPQGSARQPALRTTQLPVLSHTGAGHGPAVSRPVSRQLHVSVCCSADLSTRIKDDMKVCVCVGVSWRMGLGALVFTHQQAAIPRNPSPAPVFAHQQSSCIHLTQPGSHEGAGRPAAETNKDVSPPPPPLALLVPPTYPPYWRSPPPVSTHQQTAHEGASQRCPSSPPVCTLYIQAAMKARDAQRLDAIRFLSAAIKQREIELRESGKQVRVLLAGTQPLVGGRNSNSCWWGRVHACWRLRCNKRRALECPGLGDLLVGLGEHLCIGHLGFQGAGGARGAKGVLSTASPTASPCPYPVCLHTHACAGG